MSVRHLHNKLVNHCKINLNKIHWELDYTSIIGISIPKYGLSQQKYRLMYNSFDSLLISTQECIMSSCHLGF